MELYTYEEFKKKFKTIQNENSGDEYFECGEGMDFDFIKEMHKQNRVLTYIDDNNGTEYYATGMWRIEYLYSN